MTEYDKQAKDFLQACGARMTIKETELVDRFPNDLGNVLQKGTSVGTSINT